MVIINKWQQLWRMVDINEGALRRASSLWQRFTKLRTKVRHTASNAEDFHQLIKRDTVCNLIKRFEQTGSVQDLKRMEDPDPSTLKKTNELLKILSHSVQTSLLRMLRKNLAFQKDPFKGCFMSSNWNHVILMWCTQWMRMIQTGDYSFVKQFWKMCRRQHFSWKKSSGLMKQHLNWMTMSIGTIVFIGLLTIHMLKVKKLSTL